MIFGENDFPLIPRGKYRVIYADPPWRFVTRSAKGAGQPGSPEFHYQTMTLAEIKALPVAEVCDRDCHLFLWVTGPHLAQGFEVLKAWGFKYSTVAFVWAKMIPSRSKNPALFYDTTHDFHVGQGYTTRSNAEYVLLGRRGKPARLGKGIRQLIVAPVREHSRKPEEIRGRVRAYGAGPRLEMFARSEAVGFDSFGNEVEKFPAVRRGRVVLPSHGGGK